MRTFEGRTAVITGGGGGIGQALARALQRRGAHLALVDISADALASATAALAHPTLRVSAHVADVGALADHHRVRDEITAIHGQVSLVVLNAGVTVHGPLTAQSHEDIEWVIRTNLLGVMHGARVWLPVLQAGDAGHLVATSSMAAMAGVPLQSTYAASKAGVRAFCQSLRIESAGTSVGVTAVLPGTTATAFLTNARGRHGSFGLLARSLPRVGASPDGVATAILRGVERDQAEVLIGWDTRLVDAVSRRLPSLLPRLLGLGYRAYRRVQGEGS